MKKIVSLLFMSLLTISIFSVNAFAEKIDESELSISEVENIVLTHIDENNLNIKLGTVEYIDYLMSVLTFNEDKELSENPYYEQILFYASEYIHQVDESNILLTDENEIFDINMPYDSTIQEVKADIKQDERESEQEINEYKSLNPIQIQPLAGYNRTAAAEYAVKWHDGRNSLYNKHPLDCTNFVSQAVFAGGKAMKKPSAMPGGITKDTTNWYSERYSLPHYNYGWRETSSWVNVEDFKTYWSKTQPVVTSSSISTIINSANVGDVIQLQATSGSRFYHSLIVHKKADGTLYLAAHTNDRVNLSIKNISANQFRVINFY